jgi:hypothetical protein
MLLPRQPHGFIHPCRGPGRLAAEFDERLFQLHGGEEIVFGNQNP